MKNILGITVLAMIGLTAQGQFYYKDLVTVQLTNSQWSVLKANKVKAVKVQSFEGNNRPSEGWSVEQKITDNRMVTITQTPTEGRAELTAIYNNDGRLSQ